MMELRVFNEGRAIRETPGKKAAALRNPHPVGNRLALCCQVSDLKY